MDSGKKWLRLAVGAVMLLFIGLIYGWSIFSKPFSEAFPDWKTDQLTLPFTISIIFFCVGGFVGGKLTQRIKNRTVVLISAVLLFAGFFLLSMVLDKDNPESSFITLNIFYGVFVGFGVGLSYNAILSAIAPWFPGKTGLASGILLLGFGVGALVFGGVVGQLIAGLGLFATFAPLAVAVAVVLAIGSFAIKKPDQLIAPAPAKESEENAGVKTNSAPGTGEAKASASCDKKDFTLSETLKTPEFWLFFLWCVTVCTSGLLVIGKAVPIADAFGVLAILGLIVSVFNGAGRPINGTLYDLLGRGKAMFICTIFMLAGALMLLGGALSNSSVMILVGLPLIGISYGGSPALTSAVIAGFFGRKYFAVNFAAATFALAPAALIGQVITAQLQKTPENMYTMIFITLIVLAVIAFLLNLMLTTTAKKRGME